MGKQRKGIGAREEWPAHPYYKPTMEHQEVYDKELEAHDIHRNSSDYLDNADEQEKEWISKQFRWKGEEPKALSDEDAIKMLSDELGLDEKSAKKFMDSIKKMGYEFVGSENFDMDRVLDGSQSHMYDFRLGNQYVSFEGEVLKGLFNDKYYTNANEMFKHFSKELPPIYKFYSGRTVWYNDDASKQAGTYNPEKNLVKMNSSSLLRKYKNTPHNFKQDLEHEFTHRLDAFGGKVDSYGTKFSDHPYIKTLLNLDKTSSMYGKNHNDNSTIQAPAENLADSVVVFGRKGGTVKDSAGKVVNRETYVKENKEWATVGQTLRNAKTPRDFLNFLDDEYVKTVQRYY